MEDVDSVVDKITTGIVENGGVVNRIDTVTSEFDLGDDKKLIFIITIASPPSGTNIVVESGCKSIKNIFTTDPKEVVEHITESVKFVKEGMDKGVLKMSCL